MLRQDNSIEIDTGYKRFSYLKQKYIDTIAPPTVKRQESPKLKDYNDRFKPTKKFLTHADSYDFDLAAVRPNYNLPGYHFNHSERMHQDKVKVFTHDMMPIQQPDKSKAWVELSRRKGRED